MWLGRIPYCWPGVIKMTEEIIMVRNMALFCEGTTKSSMSPHCYKQENVTSKHKHWIMTKKNYHYHKYSLVNGLYIPIYMKWLKNPSFPTTIFYNINVIPNCWIWIYSRRQTSHIPEYTPSNVVISQLPPGEWVHQRQPQLRLEDTDLYRHPGWLCLLLQEQIPAQWNVSNSHSIFGFWILFA